MEITASRRAWLPITRLSLHLLGRKQRGDLLAADRQMNSFEATMLGAFIYLVTLTFLGTSMLPGLAILPLGRWLGWPILLLSHLFLLHLTLILASLLAVLLQVERFHITRSSWQTGFLFTITTGFSLLMLHQISWSAIAAVCWLVFLGVNAVAATLNRLLSVP